MRVLDENFLLTLETLKLSPDIVVGVEVHGATTIKQRRTKTYLVINDAQRVTLETFRTPQTVPTMLGRAILNRTCLELGEFYELVLKAYRAGVLIGPEEATDGKRPSLLRWWPGVRWQVAIGLAMIASLAFLGSIIWKPVSLEGQWVDYGWGWLIWTAALSLGFALGAAVLRKAKAELSWPRLPRVPIIPHLMFDLNDAALAPLTVRAAVELAVIGPVLLAASVGVAMSEPWALLPVVGALIVINPFWGPISRWRKLYSKKPHLSTEHDFIFSANQYPKRRLRMYWKKTDRTTLPGGIALGLIWIALVFHIVTSAVGIHYSEVVSNVSYWISAGATVGGLSAILAGGFVSWAVYALLTRRGGRMLKRVKKQTGRWTSPRKGGMTQTEILRAMSLSPLFRIVDMQRQVEIARRFTVKRIRPLRILSSGEPSGEDEVGLIVRGTAFVAQRADNGRKRSLRRYSEGDIFGAHSLVDPLRPQIEVKSRTPVLALTLPRKFFQERVVQQLGATKVHNLTHICSFLRGLPLCRYWQLSSIIRMTEIAVTRTFEAGDRIVQFSDDPRYFYVILEGTVQVMRNGKLLHRLRAGDSIGEAELLQNSAANADVIAKTATRCLAVSRTDFIRFVTHNHHVALSLETTSSRRLGHPVFPLQSSFDVR